MGEFAPKFAELNDDVLFGEVWSREDKLPARDRSLITVTALMAQGLCNSSFEHHLKTAKENGITKTEITEILTHTAFYAGWPKAWAAFRLAKDIWNEPNAENPKQNHENVMIFPIGESNTAFSKYFIGQSYLTPLSKFIMSRLNLLAETTGIFIRLQNVADKFLSALREKAIIRSSVKKHKSFCLAM